MHYTNPVLHFLSFCLLVCIAPAGFAVEASAIIPDGHAYAHNVHRSHHAGLAKRAEGHIQLFNRSAGSRWTFYDAQTGNAGSCGTFLANTGFTVAMNAAQMNSGLCFKTIRMTFGGKSTTATITDTCPGCPFNGLDLTQSLFGFFLGHIPTFEEGGVLTGDWEFASDAPPPPPATTKPPPPPKPSPTPTPKKQTVQTTPSVTTTKKPSVSTSSAKKESSTHASSSVSFSNKTVTSTGLASASAVPGGTVDAGVGNLQLLNDYIMGMGGLVMAAHNI